MYTTKCKQVSLENFHVALWAKGLPVICVALGNVGVNGFEKIASLAVVDQVSEP